MASRSASHLALALAAIVLSASPAFATWSVVAVDQATGSAVIASATCVAQGQFANFPAKGLMDIQAVVVPGKGVAVAQAAADATRANQALLFAELEKGTDPAAILELLKQDPQIANRQFGVVDVQGRAAAFSGAGNGAIAASRQGHVEGSGIYFSIQGNLLASEDVVAAAASALAAATGVLSDRVMAAMEAADARGGDKRCSCATSPLPTAPCTTRTAQVAYILRVDATDKSGDGRNNGQYAMYLSATDRDITAAEDANPVKTLRRRYDAWTKAHPR